MPADDIAVVSIQEDTNSSSQTRFPSWYYVWWTRLFLFGSTTGFHTPMTSFTRRVALKLMGLGNRLSRLASSPMRHLHQRVDAKMQIRSAPASSESITGTNTHDRVWLGGDFWANPMENWKSRRGSRRVPVDGWWPQRPSDYAPTRRYVYKVVHQCRFVLRQVESERSLTLV